MLNTPHITSALRNSRLMLNGHRTALVYLGTAAAVAAGAGSAGALAASGQAAAAVPAAYQAASSGHAATAGTSSQPVQLDSGLISSLPSLADDSVSRPVSLPQVDAAAAAATQPIAAARPATAPAATPTAPAAAGPAATAPAATAPASAALVAPAPAATPATAATGAPAAVQPAAAASPLQPSLDTWDGIEEVAANQVSGPVPAMDNPLPVAVTSPQAQIPLGPEQWQNATTITAQALDKGMGLRSAVIAVATSMQESKLVNIHYGDRDSLGLFQQRPSCGWGTPAQITDPAYASDAFLDALHSYQVSHPDWATQPVWQPAQSVQGSAFPTAYEQWEVQAANIVMGAAHNLGR